MQGRIVYARMRQLIHVDVFGQANPAPYKAFWQNEDIRTTFLKDIYSSAVAVYIHQRLQYIFVFISDTSDSLMFIQKHAWRVLQLHHLLLKIFFIYFHLIADTAAVIIYRSKRIA